MTFDFLTVVVSVLAVIVFLNVGATIRLAKGSAPASPQPEEEEIAALMRSEPMTPKHQPPKAINEGGYFSMFVDEWDRLFFDDFADFASVVNWKLGWTAWRLQELPNNDIGIDQPHFGRCYDIFHKQACVGKLEISAGVDDGGYSTEVPNVHTYIYLVWIRLLAFDDVKSFLSGIAYLVSDSNEGSKEYWKTQARITDALTRALWESLRIWRTGPAFDAHIEWDGAGYPVPAWGKLELRLDGLASMYFWYKQKFHEHAQATAAP